MQVDRAEFLRYLGWRGQATDEALLQKLDEAARRCLEIAQPRSIVRRFPLGGDLCLGGTGFVLEGRDVRAHLAGCREVYLFAATIGIAAERELARLSARGAYEALLFDTACSCAIESYCDEECGKLARAENAALTPRFSCGYGDYPLSHQPEILRLLDAQRSIGLHVSSGGIMVPRKSVTAIMGVRGCAAGKTHAPDKCGGCAAAACPYRKTPDPSGEQDK